MKVLIAILIASSMLFSSFARANEAKNEPRRIALLIGNWDYNANGKFDETPEPELQADLHNPCHDVELLKDTLAKVRFGEVETVCNVSKKEFDKRIINFSKKFDKLPPGSVVFIYYSGHGVQQYGYVFSLPVMFRIPEKLHHSKVNEQIQYLSQQAMNVQAMLERFSKRRDRAIYIALDQCRNEALQKFDAFNNAVNIRTEENVMIQYSAAPGDYSPDGVGRQSDFAKLLASEIERGGDIGSIASRVYAESLSLFDKDNAKTYSSAYAGRHFASLRSPAMTISPIHKEVPTVANTQIHTGTINRKPQTIRNVYDNPSLDILWCEGKGEEARYATAMTLAKKLAENAKKYGVGRIKLKPLPVDTNLNGGYGVWRNLMRYDPSESKERMLLEQVAVQFPELELLPQRGVGVGGAPTKNYVSAFICNGFAGQ